MHGSDSSGPHAVPFHVLAVAPDRLAGKNVTSGRTGTSPFIESFVQESSTDCRYQRGSEVCEKLADSLQHLTGAEERELFDFGRRPGEAAPLMLLLDRRDDPVTPLLLQWTFQVDNQMQKPLLQVSILLTKAVTSTHGPPCCAAAAADLKARAYGGSPMNLLADILHMHRPSPAALVASTRQELPSCNVQAMVAELLGMEYNRVDLTNRPGVSQ